MKTEIKSIYGDVLFSYDSPENTTKLTLLEALKAKANLSRADLSGANLSGADLYGADLYGADLSGANLSRADLYGADLYGANLSGANLSRANLSRANLSRADLSGANLSGADLSGADLSGANLSRADLSGADLSGANLKDAKEAAFAIAQTRILPEGDIIGYKKIKEGIVKLLIPASAKRSSAFGRKCRSESAIVLEMPEGLAIGHSIHDPNFVYQLAIEVTPNKPFDENWMEECASGIHFFITRIEAEKYQ